VNTEATQILGLLLQVMSERASVEVFVLLRHRLLYTYSTVALVVSITNFTSTVV